MWIENILVSRSKTFAFFLAMFCFGIGFGPLFLARSFWFFAILFSVLLLALIWVREKRFRFLFFLFFVFFVGVFRYGLSDISKQNQTMISHLGQTSRMEGMVASEVDQSVQSQTFTLSHITMAHQEVFGRLLVHAPIGPTLRYGDRVLISCIPKVPEPFNGFAYDRYLASKQVYAICDQVEWVDVLAHSNSIRGSLLQVKTWLNTKLDQLLPEPHSTFLSGLIFGGSSGLSKDIKDDFVKTGTSHILAASGYNVSLFTFVFFGWIIQTRLGRKKGALLTLLVVCAYVLMSGAQAAVVRAALLASFLLLEVFVKRQTSVVNALLLSASLMLAHNPRLLLDDIGFQLSFLSMLALLAVVPRVEPHLSFIPDRFGVRDAIVGSCCVLFVSTPLLLWQFGSLSIIAPIANIFILPIIPYLMGLTGLLLTVSLVHISFAKIVAVGVWFLSRYIMEMNTIFASLSFAQITILHARAMAIFSLFLLLAVWIFSYESTRRFFKKT